LWAPIERTVPHGGVIGESGKQMSMVPEGLASTGQSGSQSVLSSIGRVLSSSKGAEWGTVVAGWTAIFMMFSITADVIARKLGHSIPGVFEITEEAMMLVVFLPLAHVALNRGHVIFSFTTGRIPKWAEQFLDGMASLVGGVLSAAIAWMAWGVAWKNALIGEYREGLIDVSIWPFRFVLAIGFGLFAYYLFLLVWRDFKSALGHKPE